MLGVKGTEDPGGEGGKGGQGGEQHRVPPNPGRPQGADTRTRGMSGQHRFFRMHCRRGKERFVLVQHTDITRGIYDNAFFSFRT